MNLLMTILMRMPIHIPSVNLEGSKSPLLPSSASAKQPPCQALSVSWKLKLKDKNIRNTKNMLVD